MKGTMSIPTWSTDMHTFSASLVGLDPATNESSFDSYIVRVHLSGYKWLISRRYSLFRCLYLDLCNRYSEAMRRVPFPNRLPLIHMVPALIQRRSTQLATFLQIITNLLQEGRLELIESVQQFFALDQIESESIAERIQSQMMGINVDSGWISLSRLQLSAIVHLLLMQPVEVQLVHNNHDQPLAILDHNEQLANKDDSSITSGNNNEDKRKIPIRQPVQNGRISCYDANKLIEHLSKLSSFHLYLQSLNQIVSLDDTCRQQLERIPLTVDFDRLFPRLTELELVQIEPNRKYFKFTLPKGLKKLSWTRSMCSGDFEDFLTCLGGRGGGREDNDNTAVHSKEGKTLAGNENENNQRIISRIVLSELRMSENGLKRINSTSMRTLSNNLVSIDLSCNQLVSFDRLSELSTLKNIIISQNNIQLLPCAVTFQNLRCLILASNKIQHIAPINNLTFPKLQYLDMSTNYIASIEDISNIINLPCLSHIILTGNPLASNLRYKEFVKDLMQRDITFEESGVDQQNMIWNVNDDVA